MWFGHKSKKTRHPFGSRSEKLLFLVGLLVVPRLLAEGHNGCAGGSPGLRSQRRRHVRDNGHTARLTRERQTGH